MIAGAQRPMLICIILYWLLWLPECAASHCDLFSKRRCTDFPDWVYPHCWWWNSSQKSQIVLAAVTRSPWALEFASQDQNSSHRWVKQCHKRTIPQENHHVYRWYGMFTIPRKMGGLWLFKPLYMKYANDLAPNLVRSNNTPKSSAGYFSCLGEDMI